MSARCRRRRQRSLADLSVLSPAGKRYSDVLQRERWVLEQVFPSERGWQAEQPVQRSVTNAIVLDPFSRRLRSRFDKSFNASSKTEGARFPSSGPPEAEGALSSGGNMRPICRSTPRRRKTRAARTSHCASSFIICFLPAAQRLMRWSLGPRRGAWVVLRKRGIWHAVTRTR